MLSYFTNIDIEVIRKFQHFLFENDAYLEFMTELGLRRQTNWLNSIGSEHRVNCKKPSNLINSAFAWHKTRKGSAYWDLLDRKWERFFIIDEYEDEVF